MASPNFTTLLHEAVNKPGTIMRAYSAFHSYSLGNQLLALVQCQLRGIEPGPINTFPKWEIFADTLRRARRQSRSACPSTSSGKKQTKLAKTTTQVLQHLFIKRAGSFSVKRKARQCNCRRCQAGTQTRRYLP